MYQIMRNSDNESIRWDDNGVIASIPMDESNRHYQEYLAWVAEGNTALVIEEPEPEPQPDPPTYVTHDELKAVLARLATDTKD